MTDKTRRRLGVLGALVAVFVAVMFVVSRGESPTAPAAAPSNRSGSRAAQPAVEQVADVRLELLKADGSRDVSPPQRNLFAFKPKAPPPPDPSAARARRSGPPPPPEPVGPPPPPPIALKFIGVVNAPSQTGRLAILSDTKGNVFHGREGEIVDGRYRVLKIGTESVDLSYADGRGRQTIRLTGQ